MDAIVNGYRELLLKHEKEFKFPTEELNKFIEDD